jgi:hypothetical protein
LREAAQRFQLGLVAFQFGGGRQFAVHQQVGDFLELAGVGHVQNVVAAVVQVIAGFADGAQRGVTGGDARQGDGFFRLESGGFGHLMSPLISSVRRTARPASAQNRDS